jgi:hypothetical protein
MIRKTKKQKNDEELAAREAKRQLEMAEGYVKKLRQVPGVSMTSLGDDDDKEWVFKPTARNSLKVSLEYSRNFQGLAFTSINIVGVDCGYWHTGEEKDLDYHVELAIAALRGEIAYNLSPIFRFKEVCFRIQDFWVCTRTEANSGSYHYITHRKKLKNEDKSLVE